MDPYRVPVSAGPIGPLKNKTDDSQSSRRAYLERHLPPSFLFLPNDFDLRSRAVPQPVAAGPPRGRGTSRGGLPSLSRGGRARLASRRRKPMARSEGL
jgi:hypothetical protein